MEMDQNYLLKESVNPYWDRDRGAFVRFCNQKDQDSETVSYDIPQENASHKWNYYPKLWKKNLPHINQNLPRFQLEYDIHLSELLKEYNLLLEDLQVTENKVECTIMKENGQLQKFIIQRNPHAPYEYLTKYDILQGIGLPTVTTSGKQPEYPEMKGSSITKLRHGSLAPMSNSCENCSRNNNANEKFSSSNKTLVSSFVDNISGNVHGNLYYSPYANYIQQHSGMKSNDLSLYEETRQYKSSTGTRIERFQQYKIRPTRDEYSKETPNREKLISRISDDTKIHPQISVAERRYNEKNVEPISKTKFDLWPFIGDNLVFKDSRVSPVDNEPLNYICHGHAAQNNIISLQPKKNLNGSERNYTINERPDKKGSEKTSSHCDTGSAIPHIKFIKPQNRQLSLHNIRRCTFYSNIKLNNSVSKFKEVSSKKLINNCSYTKYVNQSKNLESTGVLKTEGRISVNEARHNQSLFQTELSDEPKKVTSEGPILNSTFDKKENFEKDQNRSGLFSTSQVVKGDESMPNILETGSKQDIQEHPTFSKHKTETYSARKEYEVALYLQQKCKLDLTKELLVTQSNERSLEIKQENETPEPITCTTTQKEINAKVPKEEKEIYNLSKIKRQTLIPNSLSELHVRPNIKDYKLNINNPCGALNNECSEDNIVYKMESHIISYKREIMNTTADTVSQINISAPTSTITDTTTHKIGSLSETKEQKISRLTNQIGKISSPNYKVRSVSEDLLGPNIISTSLKYNNVKSPELLWHEQKVRQSREAYLQRYTFGNCTPPLLEETARKRPSQNSSWDYEAKSRHNMENRQVNQVEINTVSDKSESKEVEHKSTESDQCSIM